MNKFQEIAKQAKYESPSDMAWECMLNNISCRSMTDEIQRQHGKDKALNFATSALQMMEDFKKQQ